MKTSLLFLLLVRISQTSAHAQASLTVSPGFSQFFEYQKVSLSCEPFSSGIWTVWRYTSSSHSVLSQCGSGWGQLISSGCVVNTIKLSDSGVYWCESKHRESSNAVNISVTGGTVILQSPVLPVAEGDDVTLHCKTKNSSQIPAEFFKGDTIIGRDPSRHMTIHNVSKSHEGAYRCEVGVNKSSTSWLLLRDDSYPAVLTVSPDSSQMYEYKDFSLSCGESSLSHGWRVFRYTTSDPKLSSCGDKWGSPTDFGCMLKTAKKTDSATYWCESLTKQRRNSVNITVHGGRVILQIPVRPVMMGENVTLYCKLDGSSKELAEFYKGDNNLVSSELEGNMTIYHVSTSHEGLYTCRVKDKDGKHVESPPCWLHVRDPKSTTSSSTASPVYLTVLRHLLVACPYAICTVFAVSVYPHRKTGRKPPDSIAMSPTSTDYEEPEQSYDDVNPDVTTEHHF